METTLTPERIAELHAEGRAQAARSPFVNPDAVHQSKKLLRERGEQWAASVLLRDISRRSVAVPAYPYLVDGEMETLILADRAELDALADLD